MKGLFVSVDGWTSATLQVNAGGFGTDTFTPATDNATAYAVQQEFITWGNAGARPWTGSVTFTGAVLETLNPWLGIELVSSVSVTWTANADMQTLMGFPASLASVSFKSTSGVLSSVDCIIAVRNWAQRVDGAGPHSKVGAWAINSQALSLHMPAIDLLMTEAEDGALRDALRDSSDPRTAHLYRVPTDEWVSVSLGPAVPTKSGADFYRATLQGIG